MTQDARDKPENPFVSLVFNIALPALILSKLSAEDRLGPVNALLLGLSLPLAYGVWDFAKRRKANFLAILGFVSILLTGGFGLMHVDGIWFAVKEAAIPTLMSIAVVGSLWTRTPLVKSILYNENVLDVARVDRELTSRGNSAEFNKLLVVTTWLLAASFLLSAVLNFGLAVWILKSPAGSVAFNEELGRMTALSYPVIVVPCMIVTMVALWYLLAGIKRLTGLGLEEVFKGSASQKASEGRQAP